jgi:uncharacterized protein with ATP-grasp and redox domains
MTQALRAARAASDDPAVHRQILDAVSKEIPGLDLNESPAEVSRCAYTLSQKLADNPDPYRAIRAEQNALALELEDELRAMVAKSDNPMSTALHLSAAGNIIDLGTMHADHIDVHGAIEDAVTQGFAVDHTDALVESLKTCEDLLFLLDNAGEIVFDKILIEELKKHTAVTAVVKGGPIINDAIMEDAEKIGLTDVCEVIDNGGPFIGSPLNIIPPEFRARMDRADVLLGKGQGNYETIDAYPGDVFLLLRAKCEIVARHMGVKYGEVGLISTRVRSQA